MNQANLKDRFQFLVAFAYVGSAFHGVAEQPQVATVLGTLRKRIEESAGQRARGLFVAARTDRGVHALQNYATFFLRSPIDAPRVIKEVSAHRDDGLYAVSLLRVSPHVHARGNSRGKIYRYTIMDGCAPCDLNAHPYAWQVAPALDVRKMHMAAQTLVGEMDFSSLRGGGCRAATPIKKVFYINVIGSTGGLIFIEIFGNAFLRKMIRNLVGLLAEIGAGIREPECVPAILAEKNREAAGVMAPPHGLCLVRVRFEKVARVIPSILSAS